MSLPLIGVFNSAPVLSNGVNVKTNNDTDSFDDVFGNETTTARRGVSEVEKRGKRQNWSSTLFSDNEEDNDSFSPAPVLRYGGGRGFHSNSAKDDRFDK